MDTLLKYGKRLPPVRIVHIGSDVSMSMSAVIHAVSISIWVLLSD